MAEVIWAIRRHARAASGAMNRAEARGCGRRVEGSRAKRARKGVEAAEAALQTRWLFVGKLKWTFEVSSSELMPRTKRRAEEQAGRRAASNGEVMPQRKRQGEVQAGRRAA